MKSVKELESSYNNISFITSTNNIVGIVNEYPHTITNRNKLNKVLNSFKFTNISTTLLDEGINAITLIRVLIKYNKLFAGYDEFILHDFVNLIIQGYMDKVVTFTTKIKGDKGYIAYNFYAEKLLKYPTREPEVIREHVLEYAGAFYQFTMLLIMFYVLYRDITNLYDFMDAVKWEACVGILTGFEAYTELELPYPYGAVIEELLTLTSSDGEKLAITGNQVGQAIEFKILDNIIFQDRYWKEGYMENAIWDPYEDSKVTNIFRICKGSRQNSMKLIYLRASGQRTIGRLLGLNEEDKTRCDELYDSGMFSIKNMLCFCLMAILEKCNPVDYKQSLYIPLNKLVKRLNKKGTRYIVDKIAIITLLALHPELQEEIIAKYLIHKEQREKILQEVEKLKRDISTNQEPILIRFIKDIRRSYVW